MDGSFTPVEQAQHDELKSEIEILKGDAVISGLLQSIGGLLAILNEDRRIVSLNDTLLDSLGIDDPSEVLGLRLGAAVECVHASEEPAGCGTTKHCATCGAAIAIVTSLKQDMPVERICALAATRDGRSVDIAFLVRSQPIKVDGTRFLLLFMQDITHQQQRAALERTFFHDINNLLGVLVQASEMAAKETPSPLVNIVHRAAVRLTKEVGIQRALSDSYSGSYQMIWTDVSTDQILEELQSIFANHPAALGKSIEVSAERSPFTITTDVTLLMRVLSNMVINALESTDSAGTVKVWLEDEGGSPSFCVWNRDVIPPEATARIFQRNFSTKNQPGRGIGTYSMKLFGEAHLGGQVSFTTSEEDGTVFRFAVRRPAAATARS